MTVVVPGRPPNITNKQNKIQTNQQYNSNDDDNKKQYCTHNY